MSELKDLQLNEDEVEELKEEVKSMDFNETENLSDRQLKLKAHWLQLRMIRKLFTYFNVNMENLRREYSDLVYQLYTRSKEA